MQAVQWQQAPRCCRATGASWGSATWFAVSGCSQPAQSGARGVRVLLIIIGVHGGGITPTRMSCVYTTLLCLRSRQLAAAVLLNVSSHGFDYCTITVFMSDAASMPVARHHCAAKHTPWRNFRSTQHSRLTAVSWWGGGASSSMLVQGMCTCSGR
jgi:hypothetical protein